MAEQTRGEANMAMGAVHQTGDPMVSIVKTQDISFLSFSETKLRGTVCGKSARTDLWGSGKVMSRSTRTLSNQQTGC
ncbi:hypothetical protein [Marinilabilia rubra]|uniref:hypothetical protein n=1 Tax=Marinilabilia rubra TaxID=2162893 RepID=UPI001E30E810|nr:hypothetical protein [Marinilabilia rubra]